MLINFTNHPSSQWDNNQLMAVSNYGPIIDIPFPYIQPEWDMDCIENQANEYIQQIETLLKNADKPSAVHLMGEATFSFIIVARLLSKGYKVIASTTHRNTIEKGNTKVSIYQFIRIREYRF